MNFWYRECVARNLKAAVTATNFDVLAIASALGNKPANTLRKQLTDKHG